MWLSFYVVGAAAVVEVVVVVLSVVVVVLTVAVVVLSVMVVEPVVVVDCVVNIGIGECFRGSSSI